MLLGVKSVASRRGLRKERESPSVRALLDISCQMSQVPVVHTVSKARKLRVKRVLKGEERDNHSAAPKES